MDRWSRDQPTSSAPTLYRWEDRGPSRAGCLCKVKQRVTNEAQGGWGGPAFWPWLPVVRTPLPRPLDNQQGLPPLSTIQADATPVLTARLWPSALMAAPPDPALNGEEDCLPGHGGPVRAPIGGSLARVQGWKEQGWSPQSSSCLSSPRGALATPVPPDRHSWAAGPVAQLKLDPVLYVGYQGRLRSRLGCSWCPLPGVQGGLLILVLSHPAAVPSSGSSAPPPPTPRSCPCTLWLGVITMQRPGILC